MTAHSDLDTAVSAYQGGAFEYLPKPFDIDQAVDLVRRAAAAGDARSTDVDGGPAPHPGAARPGAPSMQQVFRAIGRLSRSSMTVLITGESGTGKELVARALHRAQPARRARPSSRSTPRRFTADLLESELFGHEKGAFTGADSLRRGRFEQADGGTLFLDEIGDMSTAAADAPAARARRGRVLPRRRPDARSRSTCASSPPPTRISRSACSAACSARICSTGSTSSASSCRRCASAARTSLTAAPLPAVAARSSASSPRR